MLTEQLTETRCYKQLLRKGKGTGTATWHIFCLSVYCGIMLHCTPFGREKLCRRGSSIVESVGSWTCSSFQWMKRTFKLGSFMSATCREGQSSHDFGVLFLTEYDAIQNFSAVCLTPYQSLSKGESHTALQTIF